MTDIKDRGEVSAQVVVMAPVLFSLVFAVVHAGTLWVAAQTAQVAAVRGARAASVAPDGPARYIAAARAVDVTVGDLGGRISAPPRVTTGDNTLTVQVSVGFDAVVPFLPDRVTRAVTVPVERYMTESER